MVSHNNYIDFIKKHFDGEYEINKCNNEYINDEINIKLNNYDIDNDYKIKIIIGPKIKLMFEIDEVGNIIENQRELLYKSNDIKIRYYGCNDILIKYKINLSFVDDENIKLVDNIIEYDEYRNNEICIRIFDKCKICKITWRNFHC